MDEALVALGGAAPLLVGLCWLVWWLVRDVGRGRRRTRAAMRFAQRYQVEPGLLGRHERPAHLLHGDDSVRVAEVIEQSVQKGDGTRLNWPQDDVEAAGWVRPYAQDQCPTTEFPVLSKEMGRAAQRNRPRK